MSTTQISVGKIYGTKYGNVTVIDYVDAKNVTVKFEDGTIVKTASGHIRSGVIKNYNVPSVYGVGYIGYGKYNSNSFQYKRWLDMLRRCYSKEHHLKKPRYAECTVAKRWHNFQNFASDIEQMVGYNKLSEGWHIDKDILFKDNVNYSRKTCCLIPLEINQLLEKSNKCRGNLPIGVSYSDRSNYPYSAVLSINGRAKNLGRFASIKEAFLAYKEAKEKEIKRVAKLYKNEIDPRAYKSLINYSVEVGD